MVGEINFGLLDPSIPGKVAGSYQQGQANRLAMQDADQQRQMNALALQSRQRAMADEQSVRNAYAQSGGDPNKLAESLRGAGQYQKAIEVQGQMTAQQAAQRKAHIEEGLQHIQVIGQIAGGVQDQASYDAAKQQLVSLFGADSVANIPAQYDPNSVTQFRNQALTAGQQLEQQWKSLDYGLKQNQFGFEQQKFGAQQGLEREKMGQSASQFQQTKGLERAKMGQAESHFQQSQGLERAKLGSSNKPLTETQGKSTGFASRASEADAIIRQLGKSGTTQGGMIKQVAESVPFIGEGLGTMANVTQSESQQQVDQAQRNFINAILRQESGAAIADSEFANAKKQYFVQRGDSEKVIEQKAKNRSTAIKALAVQAGPGLERMGGGASGGWTVEEH